jgi:hypothetical protein
MKRANTTGLLIKIVLFVNSKMSKENIATVVQILESFSDAQQEQIIEHALLMTSLILVHLSPKALP